MPSLLNVSTAPVGRRADRRRSRCRPDQQTPGAGNPSITLRVYGHLFTRRRTAARAIEAAMNGRRNGAQHGHHDGQSNGTQHGFQDGHQHGQNHGHHAGAAQFFVVGNRLVQFPSGYQPAPSAYEYAVYFLVWVNDKYPPPATVTLGLGTRPRTRPLPTVSRGN